MNSEAKKGRHRKRSKGATLSEHVPRVLCNQQVAEALAISVRKLQEMVSSGEFPGSDFLIGISPRWRIETLQTWIEAKSVRAKE